MIGSSAGEAETIPGETLTISQGIVNLRLPLSRGLSEAGAAPGHGTSGAVLASRTLHFDYTMPWRRLAATARSSAWRPRWSATRTAFKELYPVSYILCGSVYRKSGVGTGTEIENPTEEMHDRK